MDGVVRRAGAKSGRGLRRIGGTSLSLLALLWVALYGSFALRWPALLDDADSVHAEVAREMLQRHDFVTLYANGVRYLEKAPMLYWAMAGSMRAAQALGHGAPDALAVAARVPLALTVLALALVVESLGRRALGSARAGLWAALVLLLSPGVFLFTRILLPDGMVCLWLAVAIWCFWWTEEDPTPNCEAVMNEAPGTEGRAVRWSCWGFGAACALGVLTKGLIGVVFPVGIVGIYLALTRGWRCGWARMRQLRPVETAAVFLTIAAPWHVLIARANPAQGHPGGLAWMKGHWLVALPTDGNVHGWAWFYFVNEQVLRYLNLRVPRDYDTVPLWLFWGLCMVWLMPWSGFLWGAVVRAVRRRKARVGASAEMLLLVWAAVPLVFFAFSTRQEYYVLPALPAMALLIAAWMDEEEAGDVAARRLGLGVSAVWAVLGGVFAVGAGYVLLLARRPGQGADLAALLAEHPGDYAMSMGHFMDLNAEALGLFRVPLAVAAASLFSGPIAAYLLRRSGRVGAGNGVLAAGAFGFLVAAHLGLQTFAPVLSSASLAGAIARQMAAAPTGEPAALVVIHQEYEFGSTLGFYLQRPGYRVENGRQVAVDPVHILTEPAYRGTREYGRSSNLWYGSYFGDAPRIFETRESLAAAWLGARRIFVWQDVAGEPGPMPGMPGPVYVVARSGGKEILSNRAGW